MASKGERFLRNLVDVGRGITGAYVEGLINQDKQAKEERELARQQQIDSLNTRYREAQIAKLEQEPTETPKGFSLGEGQRRYEPDEEGNFVEVAVNPKPPDEGKGTPAERDREEYLKLTKKPPVTPVNVPTMPEPEGGYKMTPINVPTLEDEERQNKIALLKKSIGIDESKEGLSPEEIAKLKLATIQKYLGKDKGDGTLITPEEANLIADRLIAMVTGQTEEPATREPGQQYQPAKSFHGAKTYDEAISGIDASIKSKIFTPEQAEILKQQAKEYFGVQ